MPQHDLIKNHKNIANIILQIASIGKYWWNQAKQRTTMVVQTISFQQLVKSPWQIARNEHNTFLNVILIENTVYVSMYLSCANHSNRLRYMHMHVQKATDANQTFEESNFPCFFGIYGIVVLYMLSISAFLLL